MATSQGALGDQFFYTGRVQFNEGRYTEAAEAFERLVAGAQGMELIMVQALVELASGFEMIFLRRMIDPGYLCLRESADLLERIPLTTHMDIDVRSLKDSLTEWIDYLEALGTRPGERPGKPALPTL